MADVLNFCILMEMLLVNWSTIHYCAKSKYSLLKTISVLTIFTLVFFAVAYVVWPNLGNGALIVGGLLYAFPLYWLYDVKMDQLLSIIHPAGVCIKAIPFYRDGILRPDAVLYLHSQIFPGFCQK